MSGYLGSFVPVDAQSRRCGRRALGRRQRLPARRGDRAARRSRTPSWRWRSRSCRMQRLARASRRRPAPAFAASSAFWRAACRRRCRRARRRSSRPKRSARELAARCDAVLEPREYASTTSSYWSSEKISVTLTLTPCAVSARMAGMPSGVAGTLIMTLGRPTRWARRSPSETVFSVLVASSGSTSSETRPSTPSLDSIYGQEQVARASDVLDHQRLVDVGRRLSFRRQLAQRLLVVAGSDDGPLEDRRVRGEAANPFADEAGQRARAEQPTAQVVVPDALPELVGLVHAGSCGGHRSISPVASVVGRRRRSPRLRSRLRLP